MNSEPINACGDVLLENNHKGADIASQRLDELDQCCMQAIQQCVEAQGRVDVLELGSGRCGLANALAAIEKSVVVRAVDAEDYSLYAGNRVVFIQDDILKYLTRQREQSVDVLVSQRTIHYLPYPQALELLTLAHQALRPTGKIFLSCSGLLSELGAPPYPLDITVEDRFAFLSEAMQRKHGIRHAVCLYSLAEVCELVRRAGFSILRATTSVFGNHKIVGEKR